MSDTKAKLTYEQAVQLLPDGEDIHTFRQAGPVILGADIERDTLLEVLRTARSIESSGPMAQALGHGLAVDDSHGFLFVATRQPAGDAGTSHPA